MSKEEIIKKWKRCLGKKSFILTLNELTDSEELINFLLETKPELPEIILSDVKLTQLPPLSPLTSLTFIDCSFNHLSNVEVLTELNLLQTLLLVNNDLTDVDCLSKINTLNVLNVSNNKLTSITTSSRLANLRISNNPLKKMCITSPLRHLEIQNIPMKNLTMKSTSLQSITISGSDFDVIKLDCDNLSQLFSSNNKIPSNVQLNCPRLTEIVMNQSDTNSVKLVLSQLSSLKTISLQECKLTEIPEELYHNTELRKIVLSQNRFVKLSQQLNQLVNLETFDVSDCPIEQCDDLKGMTSLKQLNVCIDGVITTNEFFKEKIIEECILYTRDYGKCDKILDGLYLGSYANAHNKVFLKQIGVTHILSVCPLEPVYPDEFKYMKINIDDRIDADLTPYFASCYDFIEEARNGGGCLVHCAAGISRSASIVISYLMKKQKWRFSESKKYTEKCRKIICPNDSFIKQLKLYEVKLLKESQWDCVIV